MEALNLRMDRATSPWNMKAAERALTTAFSSNSERALLDVLKENTFLFAELFSRQFGVQPVFHEVSFGGRHTCDFLWLNDNSDGPEWVLVEVEKPSIRLFKKNDDPTADLIHGIEQVKSWNRYFDENKDEKRRIFGAVAKFRLVLVAGTEDDWSSEAAHRWRMHHNRNDQVEIRTSTVFERALIRCKQAPHDFWSFAEHPRTRSSRELESYWKGYGYMDDFVKWQFH